MSGWDRVGAVFAFIFRGFWTFLGTIILIGVVLDGLADIVRAISGGAAS